MNEISIALVCSLIGTILGILGYARLTKKDTKDEVKEDIIKTKENVTSSVRMEAKLDYVSNGVDSIRLDMKEQGRRIDGINERLIRTEESTKSAHHRIDELIKEKEGENK